MKGSDGFELPPHLEKQFKKAKRLEWITLIYLASVAIVMYLSVGSSQAMKTAWIEDVMSMLAPLSFLIAGKFYSKKPNAMFPYGYHQAYGIAFLCGAVSLFAIGSFLLIDSCITLVKAEHASIGSVYVFGHQIWLGWIMIAALLYSSIPAVILGRLKLGLATNLHNKILYTDAVTNKADYQTAFTAIIGVLGIGLGFWWADAVAALLISLSIVNDGAQQLKIAVSDLLDRYPVHTEDHEKDELVDEVELLVKSWPWVNDARVRFREQGQIYFGEIAVTLYTPDQNVCELIAWGRKELEEYHWKLFDITITPVSQLPSPFD